MLQTGYGIAVLSAALGAGGWRGGCCWLQALRGWELCNEDACRVKVMTCSRKSGVWGLVEAEQGMP